MLNTMMSILGKRVILVRTAVESVMARGRLETKLGRLATRPLTTGRIQIGGEAMGGLR